MNIESVKALADNLHQGYAIVQEGRFIFTNKEFCEIHGYTQEELTGMSSSEVLKIIHPEDQERVNKGNILRKAGHEGNPHVRARILRKDGTIRDVEAFISVNDILGSLSTQISMIDVTSLIMEGRINESRLKLLNYSYTHSLDELLVATLDELEILTGSKIAFYHFVESDEKTLSLQAWSTRTKAEFCFAEPKGSHYPIAQAGVWTDCLIEGKPVIHNDYNSLLHKKGMPEGHAVVIRELTLPIFRNEKARALIGVGNKTTDYTEFDISVVNKLADLTFDIAERKLREENLVTTNERLDLAVKAASVGIWDWDVVTNTLIWDDTMYNLYGLRKKDFSGAYEAWISSLHPSDKDAMLDVVRLALEKNTDYNAEFRIILPDGRIRHIKAVGEVIQNRQKKAVRMIGVNFDITDRKMAEKEIFDKVEELERFNELTVDREMVMIELKKEVNVLLDRLGLPRKYAIVEQGKNDDLAT